MQIILARQAFGKGSNKGPSHNITIRMINEPSTEAS